MPPEKMKLKGIEIEKGTPMEVAEKVIGEKNVVIYPATTIKNYAGMKPEE